MCPRKNHYEVPKHIVNGIRSKTKAVRYGPYSCPICGETTLRILLLDSEKKCYIRCRCGLKTEVEYKTGKLPVDYYNDYMDNQLI